VNIDQRLIENSLKGDMRSQYELYQKYAGAMYYTCFHLMRSKENAEDMLQESFSEAFQKLDSYRFESSFGSWMKRIVINKCLNEIKRVKTDLTFEADITDHDLGKEEEDALPELKTEYIKKALETVPEGSRLIFQLYLLEGYDHTEIAEILGVSVSNSKSQYMVAKRKVREFLKQHYGIKR
jgi:RNA polymerase sigma-70 factor (ECF subfamily)